MRILDFQRPINHRDLCQVQTVKKFVEQGYSPQFYEVETRLLWMKNTAGEILQLAEMPRRIVKFLQSIQT